MHIYIYIFIHSFIYILYIHRHVCVHISTHTRMGGCQNYGPLLGPRNTECRIVIRTQKGTFLLTTTHMYVTYAHAHIQTWNTVQSTSAAPSSCVPPSRLLANQAFSGSVSPLTCATQRARAPSSEVTYANQASQTTLFCVVLQEPIGS